MSGEDIHQVRAGLGLGWAEFAARLNTSPRTLEAWASGRKQAPGCLAIALKYVKEHAGDLPDAD